MTYIKKFFTAQGGYKWKCYNSETPVFYWRLFNISNYPDNDLFVLPYLDVSDKTLGSPKLKEGDIVYFSADLKPTEPEQISNISLFLHENNKPERYS